MTKSNVAQDIAFSFYYISSISSNNNGFVVPERSLLN